MPEADELIKAAFHQAASLIAGLIVFAVLCFRVQAWKTIKRGCKKK